ncbi:hypothetical protein LP420_06640 [Massilia sp. B-10]|nr:hypothetical protein LP420_06640 [Massilia sp. B-10]
MLAVLGIMLAMMILAVSAMRAALHGERSARAERDRMIALQAAEAALIDAERDIEGARRPAAARTALFAPGAAASFEEGCGAGPGNPALGLCARTACAAAAGLAARAAGRPGSGRHALCRIWPLYGSDHAGRPRHAARTPAALHHRTAALCAGGRERGAAAGLVLPDYHDRLRRQPGPLCGAPVVLPQAWRRLGRTHEARMDPVPAAPVRLRAGRAAACRATCAAGRAARGRGLAWRCGPALAAPMSCAPASICPVRAAICCATH